MRFFPMILTLKSGARFVVMELVYLGESPGNPREGSRNLVIVR